ncbi:hypothetical protein G9A89_020777 [Geosiphon pyriformis]|nr:hypothetical protein G9A89_020777 [Geosiphon pyriformis]
MSLDSQANIEAPLIKFSFEVPFNGTENNVVFVPDLLIQQPTAASNGTPKTSILPLIPDDDETFENFLVVETENYLNHLKSKVTQPPSEFYAVARPSARQEYFKAGIFKPPEQLMEFFKNGPCLLPEKPAKKRQPGPGRPRKNPPEAKKANNATSKERKKDAVSSETTIATTTKQPRKRKTATNSSDPKEPKPRKRQAKAKIETNATLLPQSEETALKTEVRKDAMGEVTTVPEKSKRRKDKQIAGTNESGKEKKDLSANGGLTSLEISKKNIPKNLTTQKQDPPEQQDYFSSTSSLTSSLSSTPEEGSPTYNLSPVDTPTPSRPSSPIKKPTIATLLNDDSVPPRKDEIPPSTTPLTISSDSSSTTP